MDVSWVCNGDDSILKNDLSLTIYDVILKFAVSDPPSLWRAAAQRLRDSGLGADDIDATIGFIDDPHVDACLAAIMLPMSVDGSELIDFHVQPDGLITGFAEGDSPLRMSEH